MGESGGQFSYCSHFFHFSELFFQPLYFGYIRKKKHTALIFWEFRHLETKNNISFFTPYHFPVNGNNLPFIPE